MNRHATCAVHLYLLIYGIPKISHFVTNIMANQLKKLIEFLILKLWFVWEEASETEDNTQNKENAATKDSETLLDENGLHSTNFSFGHLWAEVGVAKKIGVSHVKQRKRHQPQNRN